MLIRAVVIRAPGNDHILAESSMSSQDQVVSSRFAGRIRTTWIEWGFFGKLTLWTERAVDFIRRNLQESRPVKFPRSLQKYAGADDVGPNKGDWIGDASVNVTLGSEI